MLFNICYQAHVSLEEWRGTSTLFPGYSQQPQHCQHSSIQREVADACRWTCWEIPHCSQSLLHKQRTSLRSTGKKRNHSFKEINDERQRMERTKLLRRRAYFISAPRPSPSRTHVGCGFRQTGGFSHSCTASAGIAFEDVMGERSSLWSLSFKKIDGSLPLFRDELFKAFRNFTKTAFLPFPRALTSHCTKTALTCLSLCFSISLEFPPSLQRKGTVVEGLKSL